MLEVGAVGRRAVAMRESRSFGMLLVFYRLGRVT
jgi:hypothetical protein